MDYINGYNDAVSMFENTVNRELNKLLEMKKDATREDFGRVLDSIITTLYVAKLQGDRMTDEYLADMEEAMADDYNHDLEYDKEDDCEGCPDREKCESLNAMFHDIFN